MPRDTALSRAQTRRHDAHTHEAFTQEGGGVRSLRKTPTMVYAVTQGAQGYACLLGKTSVLCFLALAFVGDERNSSKQR